MKFELLESETIFKGRVFTIRRDNLRTPDGRTTKFDIVEHHGSVVILPVDSDGNLLLVRQYRHAAVDDLLELPAGVLEKNEEPILSAGRELREETGMASDNLIELGKFYLAPGYSTELMTVFLATDLRVDPLDPDADEFLDVVKMPIAEVLSIAEAGKMPDAKTLAALLMARPHLKSYLE
ncbi:MAG: NUDIX hydrolase [Anaerolineae bacterium]|jgi:ADP-ribose pyrophosphatase|nr:NUDIX hydrolase [Anaerolineae bacterium]MBT3711750.1 NUDIX hydrolase [Anaerolineae bacterium]MBT4311274.1 NUDIX hydrolase [Anaerolineae bacterium]MBT4457111.1 NUDIX hydrolase [Anaerolineae bacterium]MBT4841804.1 NUDIX hydrolase [Anaerolineae bacterium]